MDEDDSEEYLQRKAEFLRRIVAKYDDGQGQGDAGNAPQLQIDAVRERLGAKLGSDEEGGGCLVCLEAISSRSPVWNCRYCFEMYHIGCIQQWSAQAVDLAKMSDQVAVWHCPKCRGEFSKQERPTRYECFCGKTTEPPFDPWTPAHSCGDACERPLQPCDHPCLLLCHPGACPPCPKVVTSGCFCGSAAARARRCGFQGWSCGQRCPARLACGAHPCPLLCHEGDCPPCDKRARRACQCGRARADKPCLEGAWSCGQVCAQTLNCGRHRCKLECHSGPCPPCARPGQNSCPCGKQSYTDSDCVDDLPCCGDTCGKLLDCQLHECIEQCHRGLCGTCTQERLKRCRCGAKEREWQCARPLQCELKCRQKRQCGRHPCSRRCCDGNCPPCEQPCQRPLNCGRHRCQAPCHKGPCYPCTLTGDVACACGGTVLKVACGRVKHTRPPRCRLPCRAPPDCHHPAREPHRCHAAACPPCKQRCDMQLATCTHRCAAPCHGAVLTDTNAPKQQPATPWERPKARMQLVSLPCPPCRHPVDVTCRGGHETAQVPCCEARQFSCGRACARPLPCGNHSCQLECHQTSVEGSACEECEGACSLERSADCPHPCPRPCHPAPCAPCKLTLTQPCHCGLNTIYVPCNEWSAMGAEERRAALGCGNVCPRLMECGHQCVDKCHALDVPCAQPSRCRRRLPLKCPCARRTVKLLCPQARETKLDCDEECEKAKADSQQLNSKSRVEKSQSADDISQQQTAGSRRKRKKKERLDESNGEGNRILKTIREKPLISVSISVAFIAAVIWVCFRNFMQ